MKKLLSLLLALITLIGFQHAPKVNASTIVENNSTISSVNYSSEKNVSFTLYPGDLLTEPITTTGTKVKVEFYGCSQGSAHVSVLDNGIYVTGFTIPNRGGTTVSFTFDCQSGKQLEFLVTRITGNPARGNFKIYY